MNDDFKSLELSNENTAYKSKSKTSIKNPDKKSDKKTVTKKKRLWPSLIFWIWMFIMAIALGVLVIIDAIQAIDDISNSDDGLQGFLIFLESIWIFLEAVFYIILISFSTMKFYRTWVTMSRNRILKMKEYFAINNNVNIENLSNKKIKELYKNSKKNKQVKESN